MSERYDVIVVGLGAMGSAACHHLAARGVRVLGLEQFDIPHARGSSHGYSRFIRQAYFEHPDYVPLLQRSYQLWDELEAVSGQKLLHRTGGLYMGRPDAEAIAGSLSSFIQHKLPHEVLTRQQVAERYPQFHLPGDYIGLIEPEAGFLLPEKCIAAHVEVALRRGAELHGHEGVTAWDEQPDGVRVHTARGVYRADKLVFCGGAWSDRLVRDLGVPLLVTRQVLAWVWPRRPDAFALGRLPVWMIETGRGGQHYGFPMMPDNPGFKLALHRAATPTNPDTVTRDPLPGDEETYRPLLREFIPDADGQLLALRVCLYTNSPDGHFIIDRHPRHERVSVACGFSGHGFKFASVVGEVMADLAVRGKTDLPAAFLGLARFRR